MDSFRTTADFHVFRLKTKTDLRRSVVEFAKEKNLKAGCIVSCVGSLEQFHIRFANQEAGRLQKGFFEIVSLTGTFSETSCHLHIAVADSQGQVFGGHLLDDNFVYTTAEIAVAELKDVDFHREIDPTFGYRELVIVPKRK
ncbi:MAG TPA: PPC domain-containing DNA-binding protein [Cyclobacteriaceae bacterium]|nr:PPC domain-containing DNA-binding protein [Cyclobacteriaceae bacterium]